VSFAGIGVHGKVNLLGSESSINSKKKNAKEQLCRSKGILFCHCSIV
jgi:hypothetical protein